MSTLRIASIGTGIIVDWFLASVADVEGLDYVGAFSRTIEKARSWGEPRGAKLFFDSLDELAACPDIDAVYIASPNALHIPYAKKMLAAGKHVLAEKPLASNAREAGVLSYNKCSVIINDGLKTVTVQETRKHGFITNAQSRKLSL